MIIVLHAPEDPEVESVEKLVSYMVQPGKTFVVVIASLHVLISFKRFSCIFHFGDHYYSAHDMEGSTTMGKEQGDGLRINFFLDWISFSDDYQSIRHCNATDD